MERIVEQHLSEWALAFRYGGRGSSYARAHELREIYGQAAPVPEVELSEVASGFLAGVRKLVLHAIREGGGNLVLQEEWADTPRRQGRNVPRRASVGQ